MAALVKHIACLTAISARRLAFKQTTLLCGTVLNLHSTSSHGKDSEASKDSWKDASSIYDFTAIDIDGKEVALSKYKGHVCIIVNVATK